MKRLGVSMERMLSHFGWVLRLPTFVAFALVVESMPAADLSDIIVGSVRCDYFSLDCDLLRCDEGGARSKWSYVKYTGPRYTTDRYGYAKRAIEVNSSSSIVFDKMSKLFPEGDYRLNDGLSLNDSNYGHRVVREGGVKEKDGKYYVRNYHYYLPCAVRSYAYGSSITGITIPGANATYVFWIKLNEVPKADVTIMKRVLKTASYGYSGYTYTDECAVTNASLKISVSGASSSNPLAISLSSNYETVTSGKVLTVGEWHCFALSGDYSKGGIVYLDGVSIGRMSKNVQLGYYPDVVDNRCWTDYPNYPDYSMEGSLDENPMTLTIGGFEGVVDDVVFYHGSLSAQQVKAVYEKGLPKPPTVSARQRYPWNGLVDLKFEVFGSKEVLQALTFMANDEVGGTNVPMHTLIREDGSAVSEKAAVKPGSYRWAWNSAADLPKNWKSGRVTVSLDAMPLVYTVHFDANGGVGTMADETFMGGVEQTLTANDFKRDGYTIEGWATSATGAKAYSDKQSVLDLTTTQGATVNLYAVWKSLGGVQLWVNGPYWAECNVGATKPEESGYYFWWGDTVGYSANTNSATWTSDYWSGVKWMSSTGAQMINSPFDGSTCPTYTNDNASLQFLGYIDSTGNLVAGHDAATVHLGAPWRMPTDAELSALISNCTTTWITTNGVPGRLVTGKGAYASKSIFLPAAGWGDDSYVFGVGTYGYYWSSTPHSGDSRYTWSIAFLSVSFYQDKGGRCSGKSVRPLRGFAK